MPPHPLTPFRRLHSLAEAAAFLGLLFTVAGLLGRYVWFLELFTHFKTQLAICFLGYACLELAARRRRHAAASLAIAVLNAVPVLLLYVPVETHAGNLSRPLARPFRILQANILTSNLNSPALLALVARERPDVVVLQEPDRRWLHDLAPLTNSYPVFATFPRDDNLGAAIYCTTQALSANIFLLNDPEGAPSTLARVSVSGKILTVVGTHTLAPNNTYNWRGRNRYMLDLANKLRSIGGPLVVTGDFNNTPWSATYHAFVKESGLIDSAQGRGPQPTWPVSTFPFVRIPIDHCFYSSDVHILSKRVGPDIGSDHLPLVIDLAF